MALKNTYSNSPVYQSIEKIEKALVAAGAMGISKSYDDGKITGLSFSIKIKNSEINFKLPVNWKKVQQVLINENIRVGNGDYYAYRVSWAILKDWVEAQMAILASESVTMPQLFLPYAVAKNGKTLYDSVVDDGLLLLN